MATSREKLIQILNEREETSVKILTELLGISKQRTHRILKELIQTGLIFKIGSPPKVFYRIKDKQQKIEFDLDEADQNLLADKFILIEPNGNLLRGDIAFQVWCQNRNLPTHKTLKEYKKTLTKYDQYVSKLGLIDGTQKLVNTKELKLCIDKQFYADFYAIERFGKTKLGQLLHIGKVSQSIRLIDEIISLTKDKLSSLIEFYQIDAVGYIPPTLKRDVQIMKQLKLKYNLPLPVIKINKITGEIVIPQKALSKISDRIVNAKSSIMINDERKFKKVLLIDDALGSGATINETACKLKQRKLADMVYGFAVTGSYKGFEVLSEA